MAADSAGNDLEAVGIPVTGGVAFAPSGTKAPTPAEGKTADYKWTAGKKLGLLTEDGGPEWSLEKDGDDIEFWQEGYSIPSGLSKAECKIKLAQTDPVTMEFIRGTRYDDNSSMVVDAGGNSKTYCVLVEEFFKNGTIRRRWGSNVTVKEVAEDKSERGSVLGYEVTLAFSVHADHPTGQFREWLLPDGKPITAAPGVPGPSGSPS